MARTTSASSSTMPASADLTIRLAVVRPNAYRVAPASGSVWGLSNAIAEQFSDFQFPYIESTSTCRFEYGGELPLLRMSSNSVKIAGYRLDGTAFRRCYMHARPQFREILIAQRMTRWLRIAKYPHIASKCPPARARKNYWRLCARYPELKQRLGLNEFSVYL